MNSDVEQACLPIFGRHETFHPRYGWLRKAYLAADEDPMVFSRPDAPVVLGVGKNMVNAIRYWGLAFKILIEGERERGQRVAVLEPSSFGQSLFSDGGMDPFLEREGSLWLLLWMLLRPPCLIPSWWLIFNLRDMISIDEELASKRVFQVMEGRFADDKSFPSIRKDVNCFLRTFGARRDGRSTWEEVLDSPFRDLRLLQRVSADHGKFQFADSPRRSLPPALVAVAALDYVNFTAPGQRSISVARLTSDWGSPGRAFRLGRDDLTDKLAAIVDSDNGLAMVDVAGDQQLHMTKDPTGISRELLSKYFGASPRWCPADPEVRARQLSIADVK